jgi:thymidine kinase
MFSIGTISLPKIIQSMKTTDVEIMDINVKTSILDQGYGVQNIEKKIHSNRFELEIALEDKVYLKTYYRHQPGNVVVDEIPTNIKAQ